MAGSYRWGQRIMSKLNRKSHNQSTVHEVVDIDAELFSCLSEAGGGCGCLSLSLSSLASSSSHGHGIVLLKHDEAPEFLRGNPFVVDGYRSTLPFSLCLKSLFVWNNDSVNIWTHLIGFIIFFVMMVRDNALIIFHGPSWEHAVDQAIVTAGLLCYQFCLLASTGYHVFRCHSPKAYNRWLSLDLSGILIGLLGCYLPGIHFAFYCLTIWRDVYLFAIGCMFVAVFYYQTGNRYLSPSYFRMRMLLYILLAACGIIPTFHWIYMNGGFEAEIVKTLGYRVLVVYLLGMAAFLFYITQFPERFFPGKFDFIGSSHQVWHVIIVLAFLWWHKSGEELVKYWVEHPCHS